MSQYNSMYYGVPPNANVDTENRYSYSATASQTIFPAIYTVGYVDVYVNGPKISDFTATDGLNVVLTNAATLNDEVVIVAKKNIPQLAGQLSLIGSFTATGTGFTVAPTVAVIYRISGGVCFLSIPDGSMTGTSNATSFTITGVPTICQPSGLRTLGPALMVDNTTAVLGHASITAGTITLTSTLGGVFTATGTKTLSRSEFEWVL